MKVTIRTKLMLIVAAAMTALVVVIVVSRLSFQQQGRQLGDVEGRLIPQLELGPRLEGEFERLRQGLQEAVAAQDAAALEATGAIKDRLFEQIAQSGNVLEPNESARLRWAVHEYYDTAYGVSKRLIAGETGENLVDDITRMQTKHAKAAELIKETTRLDRGELTSTFAAIRQSGERASNLRLSIGLAGLALAIGLSFWASRGVLRSVRNLSNGFSRFATGDFAHEIPIEAEDELGAAAKDANQMAQSLRRLNEQRDRTDWLRAGLAGLSKEVRGDLNPRSLAEHALAFLARRTDAVAGALYVTEKGGMLELCGQYALAEQPMDESGDRAPHGPALRFRLGEGLVGQAALNDEILVVDDFPDDYLKIQSGLGEGSPRTLVLVPLSHAGKSVGVVELALFKPCSTDVKELLASVSETLSIAIDAAKSRAALRDLLDQTQKQAERLTSQEEELRLNNQELQAQQHDLRAANEELEAQRLVLSEKNSQLLEAQWRVEQKNEELAKVSSYKSQFLANMSHELRTPLNSMLLLSHLLSENEGKNLTAKQVEHTKTIHSAGKDLLDLINQVLDLAKIEAGRQEIDLTPVPLAGFAAQARRVFEPLAADKGLALVIEIAPELPESLVTDQQRVERILTNLLANAIKFTEHGEVALRIGFASPTARFTRPELSPQTTVAFSVSDTGIGIAPEAQERVFAPFEQVESRANRRYGGTGLGLAIARESAMLLGGELQLQSSRGSGSTFTCFLPQRAVEQQSAASGSNGAAVHVEHRVADDRDRLHPNESHLLVIEDDPVLAEQLVDIIHTRGFKVILASDGLEGLRLAKERGPRGIILDVKLPDIDGFTVMERLRQEPLTRSVPVHFISGLDAAERGLALGAVGYLTKPATHADLASMVRTLTPRHNGASRRVLIVEDQQVEGRTLVKLLASQSIDAELVANAGAALEALGNGGFGCMILDLGLPDMDGLGLLEALRTRGDIEMPRVVVHTGRALTKRETRELAAYAETVILKGDNSGERLLEEMRLFLKHIEDHLPRKSMPPSARVTPDVSLEGVKLLLAEDDMRTVYALSALLRGKGADVLVADTGREALDVLARNPDIQGVLMDIMMPEMDGYEAMRKLRQDPRFVALPVIALTARAMSGERERCIEAGASDYLSKPVDSERLLSTVHAWLHKGAAE